MRSGVLPIPISAKKQKEEVEIIDASGGAKYKTFLIIGMVLILVVVVGLLIWKGPALLHQQQNNAPPSELNDYTPTSSKPGH